MSRSSRAAMSERSRSSRQAREILWPLPLRGLFGGANHAELSGSLTEVMMNWQSNGSSLIQRSGYSLLNSDMAMQRIPFDFGVAEKFITVFSDRIDYDTVTLAGTFSNDISHTTLSSNVMMADGANPIMRCDGTQIVDALITTNTGKLSSTFDGIFAHQDRLYAWDSTELAFYYGGIGAVTGNLVKFPLDMLGNITGNITSMKSMTVNAAHGMNDILVIVTSSGMVIMYEGLDPGNATDWRLLARIHTAKPVSKFSIENFGSDIWMVTARGVVSLKETLSKGILALVSQISQPISDMIAADVALYGSLSGWEMIARQDTSEVIVNVPMGLGAKQYVYNLRSNSWVNYDYPAKWWNSSFGVSSFTGLDGKQYKLTGSSYGDNGADITSIFYTAWTRMPRRTDLAYIIPTIIADGNLVVKITILTDHNETPVDITEGTQTVTIRPDQPGTSVALNDLIGVNASGRVFQLRFEVTGKNISFEKLTAGLV